MDDKVIESNHYKERYMIASLSGRLYDRKMLAAAFRRDRLTRLLSPAQRKAALTRLDDDTWMLSRKCYVPAAVIRDLFEEGLRAPEE